MRRARQVMGSIGRACGGSAALEFALLAPVMLLVIFGTLTISIGLLDQSILDYATARAARQLLTCHSANFASTLCSNLAGIVPCDAVQFYVTPVTYAAPTGDSPGAGFATLPIATIDPNGKLTLPAGVSTYGFGVASAVPEPGIPSNTTAYGTAGQDVLVQTAMIWSSIPGFLASTLTGNGAPVFTSTHTLRRGPC